MKRALALAGAASLVGFAAAAHPSGSRPVATSEVAPATRQVPVAQEQPAAALDLLFDQGKRLFDAFQYDEAVPLFDRHRASVARAAAAERSAAAERDALAYQLTTEAISLLRAAQRLTDRANSAPRDLLEPAEIVRRAARTAYREGAAQGYRDAGPPSSRDPNPPGGGPGGGGPAGSPPAWAQRLARRQRMTQAGMIAAQGLREGDRPALSPGPDLKDKS